MNNRTKKIVIIGLMSAMAYIVIFFTRFQLVPGVDFLKYDPKDVIVVITGFLFGPLTALPVNIIASFFEMITIGTSGILGMIMTVLGTAAFTTPAAIIYRNKKSLASAILGLAVGCVCMIAIMLLWNYIIVPIYQPIPRDVVAEMLIPVFLPFNALKSGFNATVTMLLYKPVVTALRHSNLFRETGDQQEKGKINWGIIFVSLFLIATLVAVVILWNNTQAA